MPTATKAKGLYAKLAEVMGLMGDIKKQGFNKAQHYAFVRESDVAEKASQLLSERTVFIAQSIESSSLQELYRTQSGMTMWLTIVDMAFQFIDGESGEKSDVVHFTGYGADTGDKGIYKAMTGAEKYFLMKTFLISTGDDPEADEKVDKAAAGAAAGAGSRIKGGKARAGTQRGGKTEAPSDVQIAEIARLTKDRGLSVEDDLVPLIKRISGGEPAEPTSIRDWLGMLTSEQLGQIIAALNVVAEESVEELGETEPLPDDEDEQGGFDIA